MVEELAEIGLRLKGLRESCDVTREEMAAELEVPLETYARWEESGEDVPISAIYHMARKFGVEFTEVLTGTAAKLQTYQVVRAGEGREVNRNPEYHFEDLAWRYTGKVMQPLLEGCMVVTWGDKEFTLCAGDSIYFNPECPHGQRCEGDVPAKFVTIIAE